MCVCLYVCEGRETNIANSHFIESSNLNEKNYFAHVKEQIITALFNIQARVEIMLIYHIIV